MSKLTRSEAISQINNILNNFRPEQRAEIIGKTWTVAFVGEGVRTSYVCDKIVLDTFNSEVFGD